MDTAPISSENNRTIGFMCIYLPNQDPSKYQVDVRLHTPRRWSQYNCPIRVLIRGENAKAPATTSENAKDPKTRSPSNTSNNPTVGLATDKSFWSSTGMQARLTIFISNLLVKQLNTQNKKWRHVLVAAIAYSYHQLLSWLEPQVMVVLSTSVADMTTAIVAYHMPMYMMSVHQMTDWTSKKRILNMGLK